MKLAAYCLSKSQGKRFFVRHLTFTNLLQIILFVYYFPHLTHFVEKTDCIYIAWALSSFVDFSSSREIAS